MSNLGENLWLEGHTAMFEDRMVTTCVVDMLRKCGKKPGKVADDMGMKQEKIRNWYYRKDRIYACDLLRLFARYAFMRDAIAVKYNWNEKLFEFQYTFGRQF